MLVSFLTIMVSNTPALAQRSDKDDMRTIRVYGISFNPILESQGNQRLSLY